MEKEIGELNEERDVLTQKIDEILEENNRISQQLQEDYDRIA
jgi:hypothetical protein